MYGIKYPVDIKYIGKFEHRNNISVNVYGHEDKKVFLLGVTTVTVTKDYYISLLVKSLIRYW